jgi:hypothetical protein
MSSLPIDIPDQDGADTSKSSPKQTPEAAKSVPQWRVVWSPVQYRPEFLDWYSKRQATLMMQIRELDDELEALNRPVTPSYWIIPLGALLGAIIGGLLI